MLNIIFQSFLFLNNCQALSWKCEYPIIDGPGSTHFLYKEENENVVKWIEKYEYCRAKGDAGKSKCEYSRDICIFDNDQCILNQNRENDPLQECQDLLTNNVLDYELDKDQKELPLPLPQPECQDDYIIESQVEEVEEVEQVVFREVEVIVSAGKSNKNFFINFFIGYCLNTFLMNPYPSL